MKTSSTIVAFHIGRGGKFNNAGHKSYCGTKKIGEFVSDLFLNFENYRKVLRKIDNRDNLLQLLQEANELLTTTSYQYLRLHDLGLDLGELIYTDHNDEPVGLTVEQEDGGIGCINQDFDYDTTYTCELGKCDADELKLILSEDEDLITDYLRELGLDVENQYLSNLIEENF